MSSAKHTASHTLWRAHTHTRCSAEVGAASSSKDSSCQDFPAAQWSCSPPPNISLHCWLSYTSPAINLLPLSGQEAQAYRKIPPLLVKWEWEDWIEREREVWFIIEQFPAGISTWLVTIRFKNLQNCTRINHRGTSMPRQELRPFVTPSAEIGILWLFHLRFIVWCPAISSMVITNQYFQWWE